MRKILLRCFLGSFIFFSMVLLFQSKVYSEEPIELKISHFGSEEWPIHADVLVPWAKKIEKLTQGRVKFTIFPNNTLSKPNQTYDAAVKGIADIAVSITEYTPGRFPLSSCLTLPFMGESGEKASIVFWSLYEKYLQDEFRDTKVLWLFCHSQGQLHTLNKQVKTLEDLKGLRIRVGYPIQARALELLGAIPVTCSMIELADFIKEGKADGAVMPWEAAKSFKVANIFQYHTVINMYTSPFFTAMNKEKYASLPADIKKIIDENSGEEMSALSGRALDSADIKARKIFEDRGDFIYILPKPELERWRRIAMSIGDSWVDEMKNKGLPGQEVLSYVINLFIQLKK